MIRQTSALIFGLFLCLSLASPRAAADRAAERRVLEYVRQHVQPGRPLLVSELYSKVFTTPDERQALGKLYNAFFRIPLFVAQYQGKFGAPPSLSTIAQQFDLESPRDADTLLRVMESDPRVPKFLARDPKTGEITHVDVATIRDDPRFSGVIERQLAGFEGKPAPEFNLARLDGGDWDLQQFHGKAVLVYVWFTGCPPCMKETPELVGLANEFAAQGLEVVGANADRVLGLGYDDAVRRRYVAEHKIQFPIVNWTKESDAAYGHVSIFPALFLISPDGMIVGHWVGYTSGEDLRRAIQPLLKARQAAQGRG